VLDFAGCISQHGPITMITPPTKKGDKAGEAPIKTCPECQELLHISVMTCPCCNYEFPPTPKPKPKLHNDDIMGREPLEMHVKTWAWNEHISQASGKTMLKVRYYSKNMVADSVTEFFPITHEGYAGDKARNMILAISKMAGCIEISETIAGQAVALNNASLREFLQSILNKLR